MSRPDTAGSLLADIANALSETLQLFLDSDESLWGPDEHEQVRALGNALDGAKKDFQELSVLVKGSWYYENDKRAESLAELSSLQLQFRAHAQLFIDWSHTGGPINPLWTRETTNLSTQLHRAQCRAANRIFAAQQEANSRCLGAFIIYRRQQRLVADAAASRRRSNHARKPSRYELTRDEVARAERGEAGGSGGGGGGNGSGGARGGTSGDGGGGTGMTKEERKMEALQLSPRRRPAPKSPKGKEIMHSPIAQEEPMGIATTMSRGPMPRGGTGGLPDIQEPVSSRPQDRYSQQADTLQHRLPLEELLPLCNELGTFERFGDSDVSYTCDFCDGHIVWNDVASLPNERSPLTITSTDADGEQYPHWQATAKQFTYPPPTTDEEHASIPAKTIVFAPLAIANHNSPNVGDWEARIFCPFCNEYTWYDRGDSEDMKYDQGEDGFETLAAFQAHLEWFHTAMAVPALPKMAGLGELASNNCLLM